MLKSITIYMGNKGVMFMAYSLVTSKRSKHIDLRCQMIRHNFAKGLFNLEYVGTDVDIADIVTEGLYKVERGQFISMLVKYVK